MACAKIGSPLGGPLDKDPPIVTRTKPQNSAVNYSPKKNIVITFDEFIQLQDIYQELIISPPLKETPSTQLKGKDLVVQFSSEAVFDSTTYTISFGNAIVDNNESNVLSNYEFIFSLKDYIDSMNVVGRVINAFNLTADEDRMFVMLYKNLNDSAPLQERPGYLCRTDKQGNFSLHNIENGYYRLFALKDINGNLIFDMPEEQIAFHDSTIVLTGTRFRDDVIIYDTLLSGLEHLQDTVISDSTALDSILSKPLIYSFNTEMVFFTQEAKNQYMVDYLRKEREKLLFTFNEPLKDTFRIIPINTQPAEPWYLLDASITNDTLIYWLTDTNLIAMDTLQFEITYPVYDSLKNIIPYVDTLIFITQAKKDDIKKSRRDKKKEEETNQQEEEMTTIKILAFSNTVKNSKAYDLNKKIGIITNTPCFSFRPEKFHMFVFEDTLEIPQKFEVTRDSGSFYKYFIDYQPEELSTYKVVILDSALMDIYGATNDTTVIQFTTQADDFYGILSISLSGIDDPVILQLMDEKENVLLEKFLSDDQKIRYEYLPPNKYILKVIIDTNNNGKWDTGRYIRKIQPEKVIYFPDEINVRSNWEIDYNWSLKY